MKEIEYIVSLDNLFSVVVEPVLGAEGEVDWEATERRMTYKAAQEIQEWVFRTDPQEFQINVTDANEDYR